MSLNVISSDRQTTLDYLWTKMRSKNAGKVNGVCLVGFADHHL